MSGKAKPARMLPVIPAGVEPALSPRAALPTNPALASLMHSPMLSRSGNITVPLKSKATPRPKDGGSVRKPPNGEGEDTSVIVAVRVRPFSKRELALGANQVISMSGSRTTITSTKGKAHFFSYDHSFWSVDSPVGGVSADQELVYTEVARPLLDSSFRGYNTCLFAYGQTGSGKSYCIMGEGEQVGIVPRFMGELFKRIDGTSDSKNTFNVQVSYFEIYNEKVYDLLGSSGKQLGTGRRQHKSKLRVREHQVFGPYVEDLSTYIATSYSDIQHWLLVGNRCRATSATSINDRSSRSHAVFSITLTHTTVGEEEEHNTVSHINIIDLAGSERSKVSETSGVQLKEGASINRSLHSLGKVISLLSDLSTGRRDKVYIPYRDSTLTWLLKESLGGNSKTAMIATISPADLHYEESLSTLRYAQQARNIVNLAKVNEDPNVKMIRELTSEIVQLKELLTMRGGDAGLAEINKLREQLLESEKLKSEATRSWQEKLQETEKRKKEELEQLKLTGTLTLNNRLPNLVNLTEDPQLSEMLLYLLKPGRTTVGNAGSVTSGQMSHDIELTGALVVRNHCVLVHEGMSVSLEPSPSPDAQTYVNGQLLKTPKLLHHGDRVVLGGDYFFRFNYPLEAESTASGKRDKGHRDFEFAKNELVRAQTERLEREWEEKILKEREQMLSELEGVQQTAQAERARQKSEYQQRIQTLNEEIEIQGQHLTAELQTKQEAELRVKELVQVNQQLQEETIAQRHIIHLEKIKAEQESKELEEQTNQLMQDLAQEKQRLEEDIDKMHKNKSMREVHLSPLSSSESLLANSQSFSSDSSLLHRGSEVVRISVMLQEATAICKALNKPLSFSREEISGGLCVRVSNTSLNLVANWDMVTFESRLEQMREIYQARGSVSSLDEQGTASPFNEDPFNDPSDGWVASPLRSLQRTRSLSLQSTPSIATPTSVNRPLHFDLYHTPSSKTSQYSSPHLAAPPPQGRPHPSADPTVAVVLRRMGQLLDWREDSCHGDVITRMFGWLGILREQSQELGQLLSNDSGVARAAVMLCCCLEALTEASRTIHEQCLHWRSVMSHDPLLEHTSAVEVSLQLQQTLCHQTALYCTKLLKGEGVAECCEEIETSLERISELLGQLVLIREVQRTLLLPTGAMGDHGELATGQQWPTPEVCGDFAAAMLQGACGRCVVTLEVTAQGVQDCLISTSTLQCLQGWVEAVDSLLESVCRFLQWLQQVQDVIWSVSDDAEPLPLSPVVTMVLMLHKLAVSISCLTRTFLEVDVHVTDTLWNHTHHVPPTDTLRNHTHQAPPTDTLPRACADAIAQCNHLAVSVLGVLKSSEVGRGLSSEVQAYSQLITQAGKALNQLVKRGVHLSTR